MRTQVFLAISALVVILVVFQVIYFPERYAAGTEAGLHAKADAILRLTAYTVGPALEFDEPEGVMRVFAGVARDPDLVAIRLYTEGGSTFASHDPESRISPRELAYTGKPTTTVRDDVVWVDMPVQSEGGTKGTLRAGFSTKAIAAEVASNLWTTLIIGLVLLLVGMGVAYWTGSYVRARLREMEEIAQKVEEIATQIRSTSVEILASSRQQEKGASEQSSAVEETRRTLESLLASGRDITEAAQVVLQNAERTHQNNQLVAEHIGRLSQQTQRIAEILEVIKDIANKSDLLALNAALEGSKAGEAGRGFSLVARQMQRLAESVMGSVGDIKSLTADIREATNATVLTTEEGIKLASDTTLSSRQISLITQQQQSGTEQVSQAMDDITHVAQQTVIGSRQTVEAIEDLTRLSDRFEALLAAFARQDGRGARQT